MFPPTKDYPMVTSIETLIDRARTVRMTPAEQEAQRRSFAYGNAKIENDNVTRAMVDQAAERIEADRKR